MDGSGNCVEVHRGSDDSNKHYYRVGKVDFGAGTIDWGPSLQYDTGSLLAVAMDVYEHAVEVHRGTGDNNNHYYHVGNVEP